VRPRARFSGIALGSTLLAMVAGELVVRALPASVLGFEFDGERFTTPREFEADGTLNSLGFHDAEPAPRDPAVRRVLLLGDSYVAGLAERVRELVGQRLESHLNEGGGAWDVLSLARPGWGQHEELAELEQRFDALAPDVVLCLFLPFNDVRNDAPELNARANAEMMELDRFRPGWFALEAAEVPGLIAPWSALNRFVSQRLALRERRADGTIPLDYHVYATPVDAEWEAAWGSTEALLVRMRDRCRAGGARFGLASASTPHGVWGSAQGLERLQESFPAMRAHTWDLDLPDRRLAELAQRNGIPFVALEPAFRDATAGGARLHWRFDGHWNAAGHDLAGRLLADFVRELR
jgi:hypothetical protein